MNQDPYGLELEEKIEEIFLWPHYIQCSQNILIDSISRLDCLPTLSQIMERKKLIETIIVSDNEDDEETFLMDCKLSGILDEAINTIFECYLNLLEIPDPTPNPLNFPCICTAVERPIFSNPTS